MTYHQQVEAYERSLIQAAVDSTESTYGAAKSLGLGRTTFIMICKRLGVQRKLGKNSFAPSHKNTGEFASPKNGRAA